MSNTKSFGDILREVFRPIEIADELEYACAGVRLHGRGVFVREYKRGEQIAKKHVQHVVRPGDLVYSTLFARAGAFAIAEKEVDGAILSEKFPTYELIDDSVDPDYLRWLFRSGTLQAIATKLVTGVAAFSLSHLSKKKFLRMRIPVPGRERQSAVVRACRDVSLAAENAMSPLLRNERLLQHVIGSAVQRVSDGFPVREIGDIGAYKLRGVQINPSEEYRQITVAMRYRGLRLRRICLGKDIASPGQCSVEEGDILFSRIDLRNGAIGIVPRSLAGAVVTRDFPVFSLHEPSATRLRFLSLMFRGPLFMEQVCEASRGTTGRKKLKREKFLRFQVPWPNESEMVDAVNSLERVYHTSRQAVEVVGKQKTLLKDLPVCLASALYNQDAAAAVDL